MLDAEPDSRHEDPDPTIGPLLAALATGVTFTVGIFTVWGFFIGGLLLYPALLVWMWPRGKKRREHEVIEVPE